MKIKKLIRINKKGDSMISESDKMLFWFIILGVIIMCVVLIVAWTSNLKSLYMDDALQPTAYESRLLYSEKCFAYQDPITRRVYTGTIDVAKFNQNALNECLSLEGLSNHAISVTLEAHKGNSSLGLTTSSPNWDMKTEKITMRTYIVQVKGYGPGIMTFFHKSGD